MAFSCPTGSRNYLLKLVMIILNYQFLEHDKNVKTECTIHFYMKTVKGILRYKTY